MPRPQPLGSFEKIFMPSKVSFAGTAIVLSLFLGIALVPQGIFYSWMKSVIPNEIWPTDGESYLFSRLSRMRETPPVGFRIAWIGGSTMREVLWSEQAFAEEFSTTSGRETEVIDLTSSGQSLGLSLSLAERAACAGNARLVAIALNVRRVTKSDLADARPWIGHRSRESEPEKQAWRKEVGADLRSSIAIRGRIGTELLTSYLWHLSGKKPMPRHRYLNLRYNQRLVERVVPANKQIPDTDRLTGILDRIEEVVRSCAGRVVYVITPVNPVLLTEDRYSAYSNAHAILKQFVRLRTAGVYFDFNRHINYKAEHFHDWGHLRSERAIRVSTTVAARLMAAYLKARLQ